MDKSSHTEHGHDGHYIVPKVVYYRVFGALLVLTVLTVAVSYVHLGPLNVVAALGIAAFKATLVAMYFMMLKYDSRVNAMVFAAGLIFLAVFLTFTMLDTEFRGQFDRSAGITVMDQQRAQQRLEQRDPGIQNGGIVAPNGVQEDEPQQEVEANEVANGTSDVEVEEAAGVE